MQVAVWAGFALRWLTASSNMMRGGDGQCLFFFAFRFSSRNRNFFMLSSKANVDIPQTKTLAWALSWNDIIVVPFVLQGFTSIVAVV